MIIFIPIKAAQNHAGKRGLFGKDNVHDLLSLAEHDFLIKYIFIQSWLKRMNIS